MVAHSARTRTRLHSRRSYQRESLGLLSNTLAQCRNGMEARACCAIDCYRFRGGFDFVRVADVSATICGHERTALIWALRYWAFDHRRAELLVQYPNGGDPLLVAAARDANDPAKLAKLMVEALVERGIGAYGWSLRPAWSIGKTGHWQVWGTYDGQIMCNDFDANNVARRNGIIWAMPTARAKLLAIMQTEPNESSRETCERMLRDERADPDELLNTIPNNDSITRRQNKSNPGRRR